MDTLTYVMYYAKSINKKKFRDFSATLLKGTNIVKGYGPLNTSTVILLGLWWCVQLILIQVYSSGLSVW